jgi:O-antigen/teichoic acid export membrane protein
MGKSDFKRINIYSSLNSLINFAVVGSTIFLTKGFIIYIFTSYIITNTSLNVIYYIKSLKYIENDKEDDGWKKQGYNLTLNSFISLSYNHIDKLLIGLLLGNEQLAIYSIAVTVVLSLKKSQKSLFDIIRNKIFSKEFRLKLEKKRIALLFVLSTIVTGFFILIIPYVILFLYSDKYISSILFAQMYLLILPLSILLMIFGNVFIKIKKEKVAIQTEVISIVLNLIGYFILIPIIGIIGAIFSSYIYYISRILLYFIFLHKYRKIV